MRTPERKSSINLAKKTPESECLREFNGYLLTFWDWQMEVNNTTLKLLRVRTGDEQDYSAATYRSLIQNLQSQLSIFSLELHDFESWMEVNEVPLGNVA